MNSIKKFIKELKRVRWPSAKDGNKTFFTILIFVSIASVILFSLAIGLTSLWNSWGVGINGK
ncbi:MAG: preprotein translocase subunit SecE [Mycoplasmataceae bacterium]|nr:preprotein translocase subunit SecE [Mycoplasmataceae bacterium]